MKTFLTNTMLLAALFAAGCADPNGAKPDGKDDKAKEAETTAAEVFKKPTPGSVADDPRVIQAKQATDTVTRCLATIRERLTTLQKSYDDKVATEKDLKSIVQKMLPLVKAAREDCDTIHRAVHDLRIEMRFAQAGYQSAADLYRQRATAYSDPDLRDITLSMADEFDRLAADVPRRQAVLNAFNWQLCETNFFLADTERCLHETEAALTILTAGPDPVEVSAQSRGFRKQLEAFIAMVEEYQRKLLSRPDVPKGAPTPEPLPPADPPPALKFAPHPVELERTKR